MSSFWEKAKLNIAEAAESVKKSSAQAAQATNRAATRTKLLGEIELHKRKIKSLKQEFGVNVFPSMCIADQDTVSRMFEEYQDKVSTLERMIEQKQEQIRILMDGGGSIAPNDASTAAVSAGFGQEKEDNEKSEGLEI